MLELKPTPLNRPYEAIIMMDDSATEEEQKSLFKKNEAILRSFSGEIHHIDTWGKRKMANPIEKKSRAIYFHSTFTASPQAIKELERTMKFNDKVLRVVHTRLSEVQSLEKHVESFKERLAETAQKEQEKEAKFKARKALRQQKQ